MKLKVMGLNPEFFRLYFLAATQVDVYTVKQNAVVMLKTFYLIVICCAW